MAKATRTIATINSVWPHQPRHVLSFENPCFTIKEWESAVESAREKSFEGSLNFLFVGRFEHEKGILRLLEALELLPADIKSSIARVRCIGEGKDQARIEAKAAEMEVPVELIGWIGREALNKVYVDSHLLFLPSSASEGFPKVIAEAAGFGCVPCVSAVSSITQYVRHQENGWVFSRLDPSAIAEDLRQIMQERKALEVMSSKGPDLASLFTFERYCERLRNEVFVGR